MKFSTEITHKVDYREFNRTISEAFSHEFDIVANEECDNDTTLSFDISGDMSEYDRETLYEWVSGNDAALKYQTRILLEWLCFTFQIPAGKYLIEVSW